MSTSLENALDIGSIGAALTICALMNFAVLPAAAPLIERFGSRRVVVWSTLLTIFGLVLLYVANGLVLFWLAIVVLGIGGGVSYPAIGAFTIGCLPREKYGPGMGIQRSFGDVGFVFGPIIAGALDDITGGHTADVALNIFLLLAAAIFFQMASRNPRAGLSAAE